MEFVTVRCHPELSKIWSKEKTFEQLVTEFLGREGQPLHLKPECFAISEPDELERIWGVPKPSEIHLPELHSQRFKLSCAAMCLGLFPSH